jgi:hypothetical protein
MDGTRRDMRVIQYCDELINDICFLVMIYYLAEKGLLNTHDMKQKSKSGTDRTITKFRWHALEFYLFVATLQVQIFHHQDNMY